MFLQGPAFQLHTMEEFLPCMHASVQNMKAAPKDSSLLDVATVRSMNSSDAVVMVQSGIYPWIEDRLAQQLESIHRKGLQDGGYFAINGRITHIFNASDPAVCFSSHCIIAITHL